MNELDLLDKEKREHTGNIRTQPEVFSSSQDVSFFDERKWEHAYRMAKMIAGTQLVPRCYQNKPADILVAFEFGRTLKLGMLQSLQNIAVVNGKPCLWGDAVLATCQGSGDFEYIKETELKDDKGLLSGYECAVKRRSYPEETIRRFTIEDAKKAGLWGQNTWAKYPKRMLQMRARGFALRDTFADALSGVAMREEVEDYDEVDVTPKKAKKAKAENMINELTE
ncbi:MAG: recombinase RecT [Colwellia sp.]|nr:recombinase RecT [Colwellia sp.]